MSRTRKMSVRRATEAAIEKSLGGLEGWDNAFTLHEITEVVEPYVRGRYHFDVLKSRVSGVLCNIARYRLDEQRLMMSVPDDTVRRWFIAKTKTEHGWMLDHLNHRIDCIVRKRNSALTIINKRFKARRAG